MLGEHTRYELRVTDLSVHGDSVGVRRVVVVVGAHSPRSIWASGVVGFLTKNEQQIMDSSILIDVITCYNGSRVVGSQLWGLLFYNFSNPPGFLFFLKEFKKPYL